MVKIVYKMMNVIDVSVWCNKSTELIVISIQIAL